MKKKNNRCGRRAAIVAAATVTMLVMAVAGGAAWYMLGYSVGYPSQERRTAEHWKQRTKDECPWTAEWMDSVYQHRCVRDTVATMPSGYRAHAIYIHAPKATRKTAIVVHGYKVRAEGMLHIAYLYNHDMGWNVLLPDLYGHGESEGESIQMGWKDRWDVIRWTEIANGIFSQGKETEQVVHGISMGAATVMAVSGEKTADYVRWFVEDCGFSGVWAEFEAQLKEQFSLPPFPLMNITSWLCDMRYGWTFSEADLTAQVRKSRKPMLFIHGDKDTYVPYAMLKPLYEAKATGRKAMYVGSGSEHAMTYSDHHEEYTRAVKDFLGASASK